MKQTIDAFLESKKVAIVGASTRAGNFGLSIMEELKKEGFSCIPVNPKFEEINEQKCYPSAKDLPQDIENIIIVTNAERANELLPGIIESHMKRIWLTRGVGKGAVSKENVELLKNSGKEYVYGFCPMMFAGKGIHKTHFWFRKNLGKMPTEYRKK